MLLPRSTLLLLLLLQSIKRLLLDDSSLRLLQPLLRLLWELLETPGLPPLPLPPSQLSALVSAMLRAAAATHRRDMGLVLLEIAVGLAAQSPCPAAELLSDALAAPELPELLQRALSERHSPPGLVGCGMQQALQLLDWWAEQRGALGLAQLLQLGVPDLAALLLLEGDDKLGATVALQTRAHALCLSLVARAVAADGPGGLVEVYGEALRHQVQVGVVRRLGLQEPGWPVACGGSSLHAAQLSTRCYAQPAALPLMSAACHSAAAAAPQELRRALLRPEPEPLVVELLGQQGLGGLVRACLPEQGTCAAEVAGQLGALGVWQLLRDVAGAAGGWPPPVAAM
jgi:hypothetical protein